MSSTDVADATRLKESGNTRFKSGEFALAQGFYAKAEKAAPSDPVYPSNLASALYEQGKYKDCLAAVTRSWSLIRNSSASTSYPEVNPGHLDLALRLSARYAKALCHGVCNGSVSREEVDGEVVRQLRTLAERHSNSAASINWNQYEVIDLQLENDDNPQKTAEDAKRRFLDLPIFKKCPNPLSEYYTIGHDDIMSLMDGFGPDINQGGLIRLRAKPRVSLLLGGVGDARHAYGTLIDAHGQFTTMGPVQQRSVKMHFTFLDIHPAALARNLIIVCLLHKLIQSNLEETRKLELRATTFYVFCGYVMPNYCHEIFLEIVNELISCLKQNSKALPPYIYIVRSSISPVLSLLEYWSTLSSKSTKKLMSIHHYTSGRVFREVRNRRNQIAVEDGLEREGEWYKHVKALAPPRGLWERDPGFESLDEFLNRRRGVLGRAEGVAQARKHVETTWKCNPTLFDGTSTECPTLSDDGFPDIPSDPFEPPSHCASFNQAYAAPGANPLDTGDESPAFHHVLRFFDSVIAALKDMGDRITVEVVCDEVTTFLPKLTAGWVENRPEHFPRKYTRIYLSNVPDYTGGILNAAVYTLPSLEDSPEAIVWFNCLLNMSAFASNEDYCHTYTLLHPRDVPRFLGCKFVGSDVLTYFVRLAPLKYPLPLSQLAKRHELVVWLTRVLFGILVNGIPKDPPMRVNLPNNLGAFTGLLVHLQKIGYPSHWLAEFVESVLNDDITTAIRPYLNRLPIPVSEINKREEQRKMDVLPWHADLEAIIANTLQTLPFSLKLPPAFPMFKDIQTYRANVEAIDLRQHTFAPYWERLASPHVPVIGLLFYKPSEEYSAEDIAHRVGLVLEEDALPPKGALQILLSQRHVDLDRGEIEWQMSRLRYEKMREEGWAMAAYRTDITVSATVPVKASEWTET